MDDPVFPFLISLFWGNSAGDNDSDNNSHYKQNKVDDDNDTLTWMFFQTFDIFRHHLHEGDI